MSGQSRTWFDRVLRTEGAIAFGQQLWGGLTLAFGTGFVTAFVTWLQGAMSQYGFAGFMVVLLVVATLVLILEERVAAYRTRHRPRKVAYVTLEGASHLVRGVSPLATTLEAARRVVQLAADGRLEVWAAKVIGRSANGIAFDVGPSLRLDTDTMGTMYPIATSADEVAEGDLHGAIILTDGTNKYSRVKVNLDQISDFLTS